MCTLSHFQSECCRITRIERILPWLTLRSVPGAVPRNRLRLPLQTSGIWTPTPRSSRAMSLRLSDVLLAVRLLRCSGECSLLPPIQNQTSNATVQPSSAGRRYSFSPSLALGTASVTIRTASIVLVPSNRRCRYATLFARPLLCWGAVTPPI